eukprot:950366-Rhodomonas_salina.2
MSVCKFSITARISTWYKGSIIRYFSTGHHVAACATSEPDIANLARRTLRRARRYGCAGHRKVHVRGIAPSETVLDIAKCTLAGWHHVTQFKTSQNALSLGSVQMGKLTRSFASAASNSSLA